jgi:hypothetical protein
MEPTTIYISAMVIAAAIVFFFRRNSNVPKEKKQDNLSERYKVTKTLISMQSCKEMYEKNPSFFLPSNYKFLENVPLSPVSKLFIFLNELTILDPLDRSELVDPFMITADSPNGIVFLLVNKTNSTEWKINESDSFRLKLTEQEMSRFAKGNFYFIATYNYEGEMRLADIKDIDMIF